ncbi:MAG TPA: S41 family peptidase [Pyrinomonadaceae bacterium]|nr:S41 family peptidase [Pyrinomonadaceae bacterium]
MGKGEKRVRGYYRHLGLWAAFVAVSAVYSISTFPFSVFPAISSSLAKGEAAFVSTSTREGRLAVFDDAWSTINARYYDRDFHGLDWEAQRTTFRSLAAEANSSQQLYATLRQMISALNDPHTRVFPPEEKFDWWRPRFVSIGIGIREVDGLPTVVHLEPRSGPDRAGIRVGDVIETVNGIPALSLVQRRLDLSTSQSAPSRSRAFAGLMEGPADTQVSVAWKRKDGQQRSGNFRRLWRQRELGMRIRHARGGVTVVEIDAFTKAIAAEFSRLFRHKIADARGVILDLRSNGGGDAEAMTDVASAFLRAGTGLGRFTGRDGSGFALMTYSKSPFTPEPITRTELPLVVLTSERTASAAEILIAALKASRRASVVGTDTCGCVLAIRTRHNLPDGGLLDVSEMDYQTAGGERLENRGIKPDEMITVQRRDLYSGRDPGLELALKRLQP